MIGVSVIEDTFEEPEPQKSQTQKLLDEDFRKPIGHKNES